MFLEIDRNFDNLVHPSFQPAIELYRGSQTVEAAELAFATAKKQSELSANDWLLLGTLSQVIGLSARCRGCYSLGFKAFPDNGKLAAMYAWELSARGQSDRCMRVLNSALKHCSDGSKGLLHAVACYNHSINRWNKTAMKFHQSAIKLANDDPVTTYVLSRAAGRRTEWKRSIELGKQPLVSFPNWARAKAALFDSLMCVGDSSSAAKLLASSTKDIRHVWSDFSHATFLEISNRFDEAIEKLNSLIDYYPAKSRMMKFATRQLVLLLMKTDRTEEARAVMDKAAIKGFEEWEKMLTSDQRKAYVSMPMIAQTQDHCVPTVAAMAAKAQGFDTSPNQLADLMETRNGTPMWKMVDAMKGMGFQVVCVKPEPAIVEAMLEQGVPLIGELSGVFSGHVDAVCGFNAGLKLFHMRDPMHWFGFSLSYDALEKRYEASCSLWALVPPERSVVIKPEWENTAAQALIDMSRAIALGDLTSAETAFAKIDDEHPLSFTRDCAARNVVLTTGQTDKQVKDEIDSISPDSEITLRQVKSMLAGINEHNADRIYEVAKANRERLSLNWIKYVKAQGLLAKMKWLEAEKLLTELSQAWPAMESLWSQLATVKEELGKTQQAERCFEIALEITPERDYFQTRSVERLKLKIPFAEQLKRHQEIEERFPYSNELKISRAVLLSDNADGLQYERALKECAKFYPRNTWAYEQLSNWYLSQNRLDKATACLKFGRKLIGEEELPIDDWERKYQGEEVTETPTISAAPAATDSLSSEERLAEFQRLYSCCVEKVSDLGFEDFQKLPELQALKKSDSGHAFNWQQSVVILSLEIKNLMLDQSTPMVTDIDARPQALKSILPESVRGTPESYVDLLLEQLPLESAARGFTQEIYEWATRLAPNSSKFPNLEFQRAYLLELISKLNESETLLKDLVKNHPTFVTGWYRIGQLQTQRLEYKAAWDTHQKCLAIQPGHYGAMYELQRLASVVAPDEAIKYLDALCKRLPYSSSQLYEAAIARAKGQNCASSIAFVETRKKLLTPSSYAVLTGRIYADTENYSRGLETIEKATIAKSDQYAADWVCVDCAVRLERMDLAKKYLDRLDKEYPDDQSVIDQKVRLLRYDAPAKAAQYAQEKIKAGVAMPILAFIDLQQRRKPADHAIKILESVKEEFRDQAALSYHEGIGELRDSQAAEKFLKYCCEQRPHLTSLRKAFVFALGTNCKAKQSIAVARKLHTEDPNNPEWLSLLGWAVQDTNPKESIELLKRELAITDSVDTLAQLARGHQLAGKNAAAIEAYEQVLQRNPNHTIALTNMMFEYNRNDRSMLQKVSDTIAKSMVGASDQYFLVAAVKLAIKHQAQLPPEWIGLAMDRIERLQVEAPFLDEQKMLRRAISVWLSCWKIPSNEFKFGLIETACAKMLWPKSKWIPAKP